ncbi:MAG: hypothetical protein VYB84_01495 [Pseudomonadota bacterium]|nr:hypothetical protein [Pseudomonadota bacterium]
MYAIVLGLEAALDFWVGRLGFECAARAEGDDPGLRAHWAATDRRIARQAMVRSAGAQNGGMHLVEWDVAAESVRAEAQVFHLCPKNLDIYVDDLPLVRRWHPLASARQRKEIQFDRG